MACGSGLWYSSVSFTYCKPCWASRGCGTRELLAVFTSLMLKDGKHHTPEAAVKACGQVALCLAVRLVTALAVMVFWDRCCLICLLGQLAPKGLSS